MMQGPDHEAEYQRHQAAKVEAEQRRIEAEKRAHQLADVGPTPKNRAERRRLERAMRKVKS